MSNETNEKNKDWQGTFAFVFMIAFGLGMGNYLAKTFDEQADFKLDLERKEYKPVIIDSELLLINIKNGKTYVLNKNEIDNTYFYEYKFLAKPKTKKVKIYNKKDPLNVF